jgi:hypothetical protein
MCAHQHARAEYLSCFKMQSADVLIAADILEGGE